jgi:pimeloyl-ACP methyl ester carboxylesterase
MLAEQAGYRTVNFSYPSMTRTPGQNAADLQALLEHQDTPVVHFLAHSMGGLVVRHLFHDHPKQRPGRVVTLGTPHQGSYAARIMHYSGLGFFVGEALEEGLMGGAPPWTAPNQLGSIAGTLNMGFGLLFPECRNPPMA